MRQTQFRLGGSDPAHPPDERRGGAERRGSGPVVQSFARIDLLSRGRAEMIVGRGSSVEAFPLFGYRLEDYDALFDEKLGLLLNVRRAGF